MNEPQTKIPEIYSQGLDVIEHSIQNEHSNMQRQYELFYHAMIPTESSMTSQEKINISEQNLKVAIACTRNRRQEKILDAVLFLGFILTITMLGGKIYSMSSSVKHNVA